MYISTIRPIVLGMMFFLIGLTPVFSQQLHDLPEDSASIGIFVCDYLSHEFEGGVVQNYPICDDYDSTGIPVIVTSQYPFDIGWLLMEYACTGDTVFFASVVWDGTGRIFVPSNFTAADSFSISGELQATPETTTYMHLTGEIIDFNSEPEIVAGADSIWNDLSQLSIIHEFAESEFHIILYFYTPSIGWIDPDIAKWILFIYRDPLTARAKNPGDRILPCDLAQINGCHPNPFNNSTTIDFALFDDFHIALRMFDIQGRKIRAFDVGRLPRGHYSQSFESGALPSGSYVLAIEADGRTVANQRVVIAK